MEKLNAPDNSFEMKKLKAVEMVAELESGIRVWFLTDYSRNGEKKYSVFPIKKEEMIIYRTKDNSNHIISEEDARRYLESDECANKDALQIIFDVIDDNKLQE